MPEGQAISPGAAAVSSWLSGTARDVVQARDITGGIHIHAQDPSTVPRPRQLPAEVSAFVGRDREFEVLRSWTHSGSGIKGGLLLIVGTAGVGKTSLAVGFAHRMRTGFPDGQLFVNLRGYDPGPPLDPHAALERFLRALGAPAGSIPADLEERAELYRTLLADRRILVVLDNAATAGQVRPLLPGDPGCLVLVTTRGRLSGLSAREGTHRITLGLLDQAEAVALVQATTAPYREPDPPEQVRELADLCARLPLALRIVAERAAVRPMMPLRDLIADLRGESSLWNALSTDDSTDADAVRSVFAWSYRALPPAAAKAFRRLGLHPGPEFGSGAAAAVVGDDPVRVRALLDLLVGAHLLEQTGPDRYQFHDLLRAYALSQVHTDESREDQAAAMRRAIEWYLHTTHAAVAASQPLVPPIDLAPRDPALRIPAFTSATQALGWYSVERSNISAAVRSAAEAGLLTLAWQLPATLFPIQDAYGALEDWSATARLGLAAARALDDPAAQAAVLHSLGAASSAARDLGDAESFRGEALDLYASIGDRNGIMRTSNALGLVYLRQRRLDEAISMFERTRALADEQGDQAWYAVAYDNLGYTYDAMGSGQRAIEHASKALQLYRVAGADAFTFIDPLLTLARTYREAGDLVQAAEHLGSAVSIVESGIVYRQLAYVVALEQADQDLVGGRHESAMEAYWQCVTLARETTDRSREAFAVDGMGRAMLARGRAREAVDFFRVAVTCAPGRLNVFEKALILGHLADALEQTPAVEEARGVRIEALRLLEGLTDQRAAALRRSQQP